MPSQDIGSLKTSYYPKKRHYKMARKKSEKILTDRNQNICNDKEPVFSEFILKEMDIAPLEKSSFDDCEIMTSPSPKLTKRTPKEQKIPLHCYKTPPNRDVYFKTYDDSILFKKQQYPQRSGEDHFSKLSDEIILYIFHWLPKHILSQCSSVCKRWKYLSYDDSLWRRYDYGRKIVKPCELENLLNRGVQILRLAQSELKSPVISVDWHQLSNNLQYLDLSMATISPSGLAQLLSVCFRLKKLSIEHCYVNAKSCCGIAQNAHLEVLNMSMCTGLCPEGLQEISINCSSLKEWNLAWTNLNSSCMNAFLPHLPKSLKKLNLSGHRDSLDDCSLITVVDSCSGLVELDISDCSLLTASSFEVMVKNCTKLQHLHTSRSYNIPTQCNRLLKNLKNFKNLEIFRTLTDEALASLRDYLPNVQINQNVFSTIARPTTGIRRTSIWGLRVRD